MVKVAGNGRTNGPGNAMPQLSGPQPAEKPEKGGDVGQQCQRVGTGCGSLLGDGWNRHTEGGEDHSSRVHHADANASSECPETMQLAIRARPDRPPAALLEESSLLHALWAEPSWVRLDWAGDEPIGRRHG